MEFNYAHRVTVSLDEDVHRKFLWYKNEYHHRTESGGIIVGVLQPNDSRYFVTDITEPQRKDSCTKSRYKRAEIGHQTIMDTLWEQSNHKKTYLGEWHTHDQDIPTPSSVDLKNWIEISRRKQNSQWLFFVIVGKTQIGVWTVDDNQVRELVPKMDLL